LYIGRKAEDLSPNVLPLFVPSPVSEGKKEQEEEKRRKEIKGKERKERRGDERKGKEILEKQFSRMSKRS
jgi:hypothetical protein